MIKESTMKTLIAVAAAFLALTGTASAADFGLADAGTSLQINGDLSRQAGAHADFTTSFKLNTNVSPYGDLAPAGDLKTLQVALPPGVTGAPAAVATCTNTQLVAGPNGKSPRCPIDSQVGVGSVYQLDFSQATVRVPVYNMQQPADLPGAFAFNYAGVVVRIEPHVRPTDFGVTATAPSISAGQPLIGSDVTLWGVPADPGHDADRFDPDLLCHDCGGFGSRNVPSDPSNPATAPDPKHVGRVVSSSPPVAFLTNPTSCSAAPVQFGITADSWQAPGVFVNSSFSSDLEGTPFVFTGCDRLPFVPKMTATPGSQLAGAPTGLSVDVSVPQSDDPYGLATATVRRVKVTLPAGMSVSPSSAAGLGACSSSQIGLGTDSVPSCPESSKLGTVSITTPLLDQPLQGDVILATQNDNPFHSLVALYIVARGPGVLLKLPGRVDLDQKTGQLTTVFDNTPQLPFSLMHLEFRGGARAPLATPTACGRYTTHTEITSWSDQTVSGDTPMTIDQGCGPGGFAPSLSAGTTYPAAGADSPFTLTMTRTDRQGQFSRIDATLPPGLLARIGSVPQCPEAAAAAGSCASVSQVGSVTTLSGPGESPLSLTGRVYLTGPYGGAPFGLSIVVPTAGQAGPFDLGDVVVRAGIYIDRTSAAATVKSDPLPIVLQGIPLQVRQVNVAIDRSRFMINPTNCTAARILAHITPAGVDASGNPVVGAINGQGAGFAQSDGSVFDASVPFGITGCGDLDYTPKLALALSGKGQTTDGKHPALTATLTQPATGQANNKMAQVALPLSLALDPDNANGLCEPTAAAADACPAKSIVGHAHAISPILSQPLDGPVYFVRGERTDPKSGRIIRTLPKLFVPLTGENGLKIDLHAASEVHNDRLVTTFDSIPDAPVSSFKLDIAGGKNGILVVSDADVCKSTQVADQQLEGQNGTTTDGAIYLQTPACPLKVLSKKTGKTSVAVKVGGLGAGKLTVSGKGIKKTTKTITKSTVATIVAKRTKGKPGKVTVSFDPTGPAKAHKTTK